MTNKQRSISPSPIRATDLENINNSFTRDKQTSTIKDIIKNTATKTSKKTDTNQKRTLNEESEPTTITNIKIEGQKNSLQASDNNDVKIINMSSKSPLRMQKKKSLSKSKANSINNNDEIYSNLNDLSQSPNKQTSKRVDFYGNQIVRNGKKHHLTFIDLIKKGSLTDVVLINKIDLENEEEGSEIKKKDSDKSKNSNGKNKNNNGTSFELKVNQKGNDKDGGSNENCSCACRIF